MEGTDDDVSFLPSVIYYYRLENMYHFYGDDTKCDELQTKLQDFKAIKEFCMKLTGILKRYDELNITPLINNDKCTMVKLWIYDHLYNEFSSSGSYKKIPADIISKLLGSWKDLDKGSKCSFNPNLNVESDFNKMKLLYDYGLDYNIIKFKIEDSTFQCSKNFVEKFNKYKENYETLKRECVNTIPTAHCTLLQNIHKLPNMGNLSVVKLCKTKDTLSRTREDGDRHSADHGTLTFGQVGLGGTVHPLPGPDGESYSQETSSNHSSPIFITTIFPLLGSLLIIFFVYKFTPFRSWLTSRLMKNKMSKLNTNEDMQETLDYEFDHYQKNVQRDPHDISYHPLQ
ncbi:PIR protein [Plasmodium ovale]|uniref:PIR protein n=1 Tax=Plasmodium ovale TaxID=36330 RepID=A0A1D3JD63_PLAOA|nr:PIR protein [Plasmodium ovale]